MAAALASAARWNFHAVLHTDILLLFQSSQRGSEGDKMCKKKIDHIVEAHKFFEGIFASVFTSSSFSLR